MITSIWLKSIVAQVQYSLYIVYTLSSTPSYPLRILFIFGLYFTEDALEYVPIMLV